MELKSIDDEVGGVVVLLRYARFHGGDVFDLITTTHEGEGEREVIGGLGIDAECNRMVNGHTFSVVVLLWVYRKRYAAKRAK